MKQLLRNSIRTPDGTELVSHRRHDYVSHTDKNGSIYAIDGGTTYQRLIFTKDDFVNTSLDSTDDIEVLREGVTWGTYGKDGKSKLKHIKIKDMEDSHIQAVLKTQILNAGMLDLFNREIHYRKSL